MSRLGAAHRAGGLALAMAAAAAPARGQERGVVVRMADSLAPCT